MNKNTTITNRYEKGQILLSLDSIRKVFQNENEVNRFYTIKKKYPK